MSARWPLVAFAVLVPAACSTLESGTIALVTGMDGSSPFGEPTCTEGGTPFCGPDPTSIVISAVTVASDDGGSNVSKVLATQPYSGGSTISLPQISIDNVDVLQATAYDSADAAVIFGQTLPVDVGGIDGLTLDLFVQRRNQFATLPSPLPEATTSPIAAVLAGHYVVVGSTSSRQASIYDLLLWGLVETAESGQTTTELPCAPLSMAPLAGTTIVLLVCENQDSTFAGQLFDIAGVASPSQLQIPTGDGGPDAGRPIAWEDIAGGTTVLAPDGDVYIVGGTRPASLKLPPTTAVLKVTAGFAPDGGGTVTSADIVPLNFSAKRTGAAAMWSSAKGSVVIVAGNTHGGPGVEWFTQAAGDGGTDQTGCAANEAQGSGAAIVGASAEQVIVAGGKLPDGSFAPTSGYDISNGCKPIAVRGSSDGGGSRDSGRKDSSGPHGESGAGDAEAGSGHSDGGGHGEGGTGPGDAGVGASLPIASAQAFGFAQLTPAAPPAGLTDSATSAIFIGSEKDGTTHAFVLSAATSASLAQPIEIPLRVPMRHGSASAVLTPIPSVIVVGGDVTMESYIP